jgi:peroxiredoxin
MRPDIVPGATFPDYELSDHTAKRRKLSDLQGQHPMLLVLSRGGFCPKDRRQAEGLVQLHRELEVAYCRLVTISTDNITETNEYRTGIGAHWPFLSDAGRIVGRTGTSPPPNSKQRGSKAAKTSSILTAKPTFKPSVNRIKRGAATGAVPHHQFCRHTAVVHRVPCRGFSMRRPPS